MNVVYDGSVPGDSDYDWSRFTRRIPVAQPVGNIFPLLQTRFGIETWFLRESIFTAATGTERRGDESVVQGDQYAWRWHGWPDDVQEHDIILENNGKDQVCFTFAGNCKAC